MKVFSEASTFTCTEKTAPNSPYTAKCFLYNSHWSPDEYYKEHGVFTQQTDQPLSYFLKLCWTEKWVFMTQKHQRLINDVITPAHVRFSQDIQTDLSRLDILHSTRLKITQPQICQMPNNPKWRRKRSHCCLLKQVDTLYNKVSFNNISCIMHYALANITISNKLLQHLLMLVNANTRVSLLCISYLRNILKMLELTYTKMNKWCVSSCLFKWC